MRLKNKTDSAQQINDIGGSAHSALPGEIIEINEKIVYKEELERAKNFFSVIEEPIRSYKKEIIKEEIRIPKKDKEEVS